MKIDPEQLSAALKRALLPVYLVAGEEPLLLDETLDAIRSTARAQGFTERQVLDVERGFDWSEALDACTSMSLFGDRRIVELRMPTGNPGADGAQQLQRLATQASGDTLLLVVCGALDKRQRGSDWYAALEQAGASIYLWPVETARFAGWLEARLRQRGLVADADALQLLAERTEGNLLAAAQDVEKLALLYPDGRIDAARVRQTVADSARYDVFDLAEYLLLGDGAGIARAFRHLREEGVEVAEMLGGIAWTLRQWIAAQQALADGGDAAMACERARIPRPRQPAMRRALARGRTVQLYGWLRRLTRIDQLAKSTHGREQAAEELLTWLLAVGTVPIATQST